MKLLQTSELKAFTATLERPATPGLPAPSTRSSAPCALNLSVPNPPAAGLEGAPATGRWEVFQDLMIVNAINLEFFSLRSQSKSSLRNIPKNHPSQTLQTKKNQKTRQFSPRNHGFPMNLVSLPDLASSHWFKELQVLWCWPKIGGVLYTKRSIDVYLYLVFNEMMCISLPIFGTINIVLEVRMYHFFVPDIRLLSFQL